MLGTMSNGDKDPAIVTSVLNDPTAKKYIKVIGMQWGMLSHVGDAKSAGVNIWQTEHVAGNCPFGGTNCKAASSSNAPNDQAYGVESWNLIRDWIKTGITSYSARGTW
jgi:glucosylceramidase